MSTRFPRRATLLTAAVVLTAATSTWLIVHRTSAPSEPAEATSPAVQTPPTASRGGALHALPTGTAREMPIHRTGMQATYQIALSSETRFDLGQQMHQRLQDVRITLTGRWTVTVVAVADDSVKLSATLGQPRLTMTPPSDARQMDSTRADLETRHYFTMGRDGKVQATHFPRGLDPMARSLLKGVIAASQVTWPAPPADAWQTEEQVLEGEVLVAYGRLPTGADTLEKRIVRYVRVAAEEGAVPTQEVGTYSVSGRAELAVDALGWLANREGAETLRVAPEGGLLAVVERRTSQFSQVQRREDPSLARNHELDWPQLVTSTLIDVQRLKTNRGQIDRAWVAGASLASLLAALRATPAGAAGAQARAALIPRLAALLRLEPHNASALVAAVREGAESGLNPTLLAALSSAGTPEAQQGLVDLGNDTALSDEDRLRAVGLLGLSKSPTAETAVALEAWMSSGDGNMAETATLALGNHVKRRNEDGGDEATTQTTDIVEALIAALNAAQTPSQRALLLKALGNTGDPRAVSAIVAQLATEDVSVRAAALWALRFMPGPEVEALLTEALLKDPALAPRQAVVAGAAFRSLVPLGPALHQMARTYPDKALRLDIVHLLGVSKDRYPPGIVTLKWVAEHDGAADVRQAALAALQPQSIPGPKVEVVP